MMGSAQILGVAQYRLSAVTFPAHSSILIFALLVLVDAPVFVCAKPGRRNCFQHVSACSGPSPRFPSIVRGGMPEQVSHFFLAPNPFYI